MSIFKTFDVIVVPFPFTDRAEIKKRPALVLSSTNYFKGLKYLQETVGKQFVRGIVLYTGSEVIPFGAQLHALPISSLWRAEVIF